MHRRLVGRAFAVSIALSFATVALTPRTSRATNVLTQHNDVARTGANLEEGALNTSNVNVDKFGKLFARPLVGSEYAQPLYFHGLVMPGVGSKNVVFTATMHNVVSAWDGDDPSASAPLWSVTLEPSSSLPDSNIGYACGTYKDISGEIGVVGTPVIDEATRVMYLVTFTRTGAPGSASAVYAHTLHALDITTGAEVFGAPIKITASASGGGAGSVSGSIALQSRFQNQRASLLLANGNVYVAFAAYCDTGPYHGWILAYDARTLAQKAIYNDTPAGTEGGIWMAGQGPSIDDLGNVYVMTGNGTTSAPSGGPDFATSFLKLTPSLTLTDWFSPYNYASLNTGDQDLGSSGVLVMPGTNLLVGGGKEGKIYLLDRSNLGHYHAGVDSQIVQSFQVTTGGHIHGSPIYWKSSTTPFIYVQGERDYLKAFAFDGAKFSTTPSSKSPTAAGLGMPGGILAISAKGSSAGSAIVWDNLPIAADANQRVVPGVLRAYDAADLSRVLWTSETNAARDSFGNFAKFCPATVVDGKVYMATFSNQLVAYGLLASQTTCSAAPNPSVFGQPITLSSSVSGPASGAPTGTIAFTEGATTLATTTLDPSATTSTTLLSGLPVSAHTFVASYSGDAKFNPSTSTACVQTVNAADTTTTLSAAPGSSSYGGAITLSARVDVVAPGAGTPTGALTFVEGSTVLGSTVLDASATASLTLSTLPVGPHTLAAIYAGDGNFKASIAPTVTETIVKATSATTLLIAPPTSRLGDVVRLTAAVSGGASGSVTFRDGGAVLLGTCTLSGADASCSFDARDLSVGDHAIVALYGGDDRYTESASAPSTATVTSGASAVSLTSSINPSASGQAVTLRASVRGLVAPTPSGSVDFLDGTVAIGAGILDGFGDATIVVSTLGVGDHALTARYRGDGSYGAATSATVVQSVGKLPTTTTLAASSNAATFGDALTFTAMVSGSGAPTGAVTFRDGDVVVGAMALDHDVASTTISTLSPATHTITATYEGDSTHAGSGASVSVTIASRSDGGLGDAGDAGEEASTSEVGLDDADGGGDAGSGEIPGTNGCSCRATSDASSSSSWLSMTALGVCVALGRRRRSLCRS